MAVRRKCPYLYTSPYLTALSCLLLLLAVLTDEALGISPSLGRPIVTEYRWGAWTKYSTCTRSCGIGIKVRQRACFKFGLTPQPVDVVFCGGVSTNAKTCNTQQCPIGARDFRALQCSFFNGRKHGGRDYHTWVPYRTAKYGGYTKVGSCALACTPYRRGHFVVQFSSQVVDGTECSERPHGVCVAGQCVSAGCDNQLHSRAHLDWCGVCTGDNSTCDTLSGNIAKNITVGYQELLTIPSGARHINIVDRDSSNITLALRNTQGTIFIKGHLETRYSTITRLVAGTVFYYHHPLLDGRGMESLQAEGPTNQDLVVMSYTKSPGESLRLLYEYTVNKSPHQPLLTTIHPLQEKSLPWEAILYDKLHPGYNIGEVGSAYVKRKKGSHEKHLRFGIPPWKPPEPSLPITSEPSAKVDEAPIGRKSYTVTQGPKPYQPHAFQPIFKSHKSHTSVQRRLKTHKIGRKTSFQTVSQRTVPPQVEQAELSFVRSPTTKSTNHIPEKNVHGLTPISDHTEAFSRPVTTSSFTLNSSQAISTMNISNISTVTSIFHDPSTAQNESHAEQTTIKHPVKDKMPVFIPVETENEQGFRMTEDVITSDNHNHKSDYKSEREGSNHRYDEYLTHGDHHGHHRTQHARTEHQDVGSHDHDPHQHAAGNHGDRGHHDVDHQQPHREGLMVHKDGADPAHSQAFSSSDRQSRADYYSKSSSQAEDHSDPRYQWKPKDITPCSSTCAPGGLQFEFFECKRKVDGLTVADNYCDVRRKPDPRYHECTRHQCIARWVAGIWSHCSRSCGEGQTFRSVRCWRMLAPGFDSTVHADQCQSYKKPEATKKCNEGACGPQWQFSAWGKCSAECGRGQQLRTVRCNTGYSRDCHTSPRPEERRSCGSSSCDNYWETSKWASCSGPCGSGIKQRRVVCRASGRRVLDERGCDSNTKPLSVHACGGEEYCPFVWVPQRWDKCSAECGEGIADRKVVCGAVSSGRFQLHPESYCQQLTKPISTARCRELPCQPKWLTTGWSKCSKSCGRGGVKMREVRCYLGNEESNGCGVSSKPKSSEECPLPSCPEERKEDPCIDDKKRINCALVVKVQLCHHWHYKSVCCKSCRDSNQQNGGHHNNGGVEKDRG